MSKWVLRCEDIHRDNFVSVSVLPPGEVDCKEIGDCVPGPGATSPDLCLPALDYLRRCSQVGCPRRARALTPACKVLARRGVSFAEVQETLCLLRPGGLRFGGYVSVPMPSTKKRE